jgi:multidrug efflux pump subunit AcrB
MIRYLIQRPVAVLMVFISLIIAGFSLINKIPVSLLPNIDVPQIIVRMTYPNTSANAMEENMLRPMREGLTQLNHLKNIESRAANHSALVYLTFEFGTKMDMAYIEATEKVRRIAANFPADMPEPQVIRINTSDIPLIRVQVVPQHEEDYLQVSLLTEKTLKKRLEQIDGVSLVDINGLEKTIITVQPNKEQLNALGENEDIIARTIRNANADMGGLNIKDGQFRYFVKLSNSLSSIEQIRLLPIRLSDGMVVPLEKLAEVNLEPEAPIGYHLYNGNKGLVITVQKQPDSRMNDLVPKIKSVINQFKSDYPGINFSLTQDQSFLLDAGISNLYQDLIYGGILTILLLFAFLGNWQAPTLMSISIPLSLVLTFILFYLFNISFNIISLSGLALGIGMLIDNSIVVVDSITRKCKHGINIADSAVNGTNEVITPVISQVLTTVAVYAPLVLFSGIAGALVFDQSIALTISLMISLTVAFILTPLLYKLFIKPGSLTLKDDTIFYKWVSVRYHKMMHHIIKHRATYIIITILIMPVGIVLAKFIPVSTLPTLEKKESLVHIDWRMPIDAKENLQRTQELLTIIQKGCITTEAEVGIRQFLLQTEENAIQKTDLYFACESQHKKNQQDNSLKNFIARHYPNATTTIFDAPNAFTQLFENNNAYLEARFTPIKSTSGKNVWASLEGIMDSISNKSFTKGDGLIQERSVNLILDTRKMALYGISMTAIEDKLQQLFGTYSIAEIKRFGDIRPIRLKVNETTEMGKQLIAEVNSNNNTTYPLNTFVAMVYAYQPKFITCDRTGEYKSIIFEKKMKNGDALQKEITDLASRHGFYVYFTGTHFETRQYIAQLWYIFFLVLGLLYIILAIQYENLVLPFVVMLTIPLGISGSMFLLWITHGTLDIMAAVGFIVILGLIVDDPILKVETLKRLEQKYTALGMEKNSDLLEKMIHEAGDICLKPLLLVSLTTSIAVVPVLFVGGIGNDLQKPLAIVIIGGLTIGTFFTTWFIPLSYWYLSKWKIIK